MCPGKAEQPRSCSAADPTAATEVLHTCRQDCGVVLLGHFGDVGKQPGVQVIDFAQRRCICRTGGGAAARSLHSALTIRVLCSTGNDGSASRQVHRHVFLTRVRAFLCKPAAIRNPKHAAVLCVPHLFSGLNFLGTCSDCTGLLYLLVIILTVNRMVHKSASLTPLASVCLAPPARGGDTPLRGKHSTPQESRFEIPTCVRH